MSALDAALDAIRSHPGVEHVLVLGRDGLLIQHAGDRSLDAETVSAMIPGIASAVQGLATAADAGSARTVVARMDRGVAVVSILSSEILLAVLLSGDVGFAPLLRDLGERHDQFASLV